MNIVFLSPHFPKNCTMFCHYLKTFGANVLGVGDAAYDALGDDLKRSMTEYYKVSDMNDYDQVFRAVGFFTHQYGKIDRFESLNEYWLETEARIRSDFNIYGTKIDFVSNLKQKSKMKYFFNKSGVQSARYLAYTTKTSAKDFIREVGYPVIVKPNVGAGAHLTYKIRSDKEFEAFYQSKPSDVQFLLEEYIDGVVYTYDGLIDRSGVVQFSDSHLFEHSIMNIVNTDDHLSYICLKNIEPEIEKAGKSVLKAFDIRERFFHLKFFKSSLDNRLYALEVNMRPPGGWMTDAINYSYDINIYEQWANLLVNNRVDVQKDYCGKYFTAFASRKNKKLYVHSHEEILEAYPDILKHAPVEEVFSLFMGNYAYQFRAETLEEVQAFVSFVQEERADYCI
jgi:biotin carboxylase